MALLHRTPLSPSRLSAGESDPKYIPSEIQQPQLPTATKTLCSQCQALDLHAAFKSQSQLGIRHLPLSSESEQCQLCQLFVSVGESCPGWGTGDESASFTIVSVQYRWFASRTMSNRKIYDEKLFCLVVYPTQWGDLSSVSPEYLECAILQADRGAQLDDSVAKTFSGRIVKRRTVNYHLVKAWLAWCWNHHPDNCFRQSPSAFAALREVNLRVIDCKERVVRDYQPGMPFAALSYVWGSSLPDPAWRPEAGKALPQHVPNTISDAILVCNRVGIENIWVDQYCIDQKDNEDTAQHVSRMDYIYSHSRLTIIAAAGDNAEYGLPGVSKRAKCAASKPVLVQGKVLVSTLRRPADVITSSKWASRGWTYQEGVLANRRLVFTDEQVSFECRGMECSESVCRPLSVISVDDRRKVRNEVRPGYFRSKCQPNRKRLGVRFSRTTIWQHIVAFNSRNLSFESDRLFAFSGILAHFGFHIQGSHIQGIPIDSVDYRRTANWERSARASAMTSHEVSFIAGLCWHTARFPTYQSFSSQARRPSFPSFTWLGWTGPIAFEAIRIAFGTKLYEALIRFEAFRDGSWRLPSFNAQSGNGLVCTAVTLEVVIKVAVTDVSVAELKIQSAEDPELQMEFTNRWCRLSCPSMADEFCEASQHESCLEEIVIQRRVTVLRLMNYYLAGELDRAYLMLVERHKDHVERIGMLQLHQSFCNIKDLDEWPAKMETLLLR